MKDCEGGNGELKGGGGWNVREGCGGFKRENGAGSWAGWKGRDMLNKDGNAPLGSASGLVGAARMGLAAVVCEGWGASKKGGLSVMFVALSLPRGCGNTLLDPGLASEPELVGGRGCHGSSLSRSRAEYGERADGVGRSSWGPRTVRRGGSWRDGTGGGVVPGLAVLDAPVDGDDPCADDIRMESKWMYSRLQGRRGGGGWRTWNRGVCYKDEGGIASHRRMLVALGQPASSWVIDRCPSARIVPVASSGAGNAADYLIHQQRAPPARISGSDPSLPEYHLRRHVIRPQPSLRHPATLPLPRATSGSPPIPPVPQPASSAIHQLSLSLPPKPSIAA